MNPRWFAATLLSTVVASDGFSAGLQVPREPAPHPLSIAYLSTDSEAGDARHLRVLGATLGRYGLASSTIRVDHFEIPLEGSGAAISRAVGPGALPYSVIFASTINLAREAKRIAPESPLVFDGASDPVQTCLVDSMTHPGGNATGYTSDIGAEPKMLEALLDVFPTVQHAMILVDDKEDDPRHVPAVSPRTARSQRARARGGSSSRPMSAAA